MREQLQKIKLTAQQELSECSDLKELEQLRIKFLGKKGELTSVLRLMGSLSADERPQIGALANEVRKFIETTIEQKKDMLNKSALLARLKDERIDVTMPGCKIKIGKEHPLTIVLNEIKEIFLVI